MTQPNLGKELVAEIESVVEGAGCELVHAEFQKGVLRVYIDRPEGGVELADCESVSRELSPILDIHDFAKQRYVLEVSSPGLDRQLYRPRDYERFTGYRVRVSFLRGEPRKKATVVGRLEAFDPARGGTLTLSEETTRTIHEIPLDDVKIARLEIDQDPAPAERWAGSQA